MPGIVSVAAHPSGVIAASPSLDRFVRVFDADTNNTIATLDAPPSEAWQMQFSRAGTILAVAGGSSASVKLWDTATSKLLDTLTIPGPESAKSADRNGRNNLCL